MLPAWLLDRVLLPLHKARSIEGYTHSGDLITVGDLLRVMNQYSDGFTVAPLADKTGVFKSPESGYCVALPGIECLVDLESEYEAPAGSRLEAWANRTARWWPGVLPVAQLVSGVTPLPAVAWVRRMLSPAVMTTWAWCSSRSTVALAMVLGMSSSNPAG